MSVLLEHQRSYSATKPVSAALKYSFDVDGLQCLAICRRFAGDFTEIGADSEMIFRFGEFELDLATVELRRHGSAVAIEPQVFAVLAYLIEHRERMVSRDELIDQVWHGRVVSDAAVASRIKFARTAVGDDGNAQRVIRTIRGRGFRFVGDVELPPATTAPVAAIVDSGEIQQPAALPRRPSIAVLPFGGTSTGPTRSLLREALPHELITALARVRWLAVIARGSAFRFTADFDVLEVGRALDVRYCLTGLIEGRGKRLNVSVDLIDTGDRSVLWSESLSFLIDDLHAARESIVSSVVAALEIQIPLNEARNARLQASESLDAWGQYHLGLQAMYRFNRHDNAAAEVHFARALELDPGFARAHAGLSFTSFQDAFLNYSGRIDASTLRARRHAERSVELDPLDPFSNLAMGRAYYLAGEIEPSLGWLDRSVELSPSFAQAQYCRAWSNTIAGRGSIGREGADRAMRLSPLDPLLYAMRSTRALSHIVAEEYAAAAPWADKGAMSPGAHMLIGMIAVAAHALAGDADRARYWAADVRRRRPDATSTLFFQSFPFADMATRSRVEQALAGNGIGP